MKDISILKQEAKIKADETKVNFESRLIPIAEKIFDGNKEKFLLKIENHAKDSMGKGYKRMFFQMYGQIEEICKDFNISEHLEIGFISGYIEDKLIAILKKQGYLFSYVYSRTDYFHTNFYMFWSKFDFIKCKIKNCLRIEE